MFMDQLEIFLDYQHFCFSTFNFQRINLFEISIFIL